ncbi:NAD-glutamate dehydrogenase [Martelella alba]|uniref:NAD-glutamate dehydrogenase n=1 Tax=Martelella alba TaxID=2590451 RepID=A0A506UCI5_9HYPH|nr:NAD-glutamate dehydrogenase [Martelella alba]TPW31126.1 NAD-glutamate dehydrogenase [Martelella alba]
MYTTNDTKRQEKLKAAEESARNSGLRFISPDIMFARASREDLDRYEPAMLGAVAAHAASELSAWQAGAPRVSIGPVAGVAPGGAAIDVIAITLANMPFIYDSVMAEIAEHTADILLAIHPILVVTPDAAVEAFSPERPHDAEQRISHVQVHIARLGPGLADRLKARLEQVLHHVDLAVSDWPLMLGKLEAAMGELASRVPVAKVEVRDEAFAFLEWLRDGNFTFLGMRDLLYVSDEAGGRVEHVEGSSIGILADPDMRVLRSGAKPVASTPEILAFLEGPDYLIVTKANTTSTVHRRTHMDYIGVKRLDAEGRVVGELRIVGLFTFTAYTQAARRIPLLRAKVDQVVARFGFEEKSHAGRSLQNILESYPRDELFQTPVETLTEFCGQILEVAERPKIRVLTRVDRFDRFVSVLVFVPRQLYDSRLREQIGDYLARVYEGRVAAYYPGFPEGHSARVHFIIARHKAEKTPEIPQAVLEETVTNLASDWSERFRHLAGPGAVRLGVSEAYRAAFRPDEAVADLDRIVAAGESGAPRIAFYRPADGDSADELRLKIFKAGGPLALSQRVPLLENLGFTVLSERTFDLTLDNGFDPPGDLVLHDMELMVEALTPVDLVADAARLERAFMDVLSGVIDNDSFNRLVLVAGLEAGEANVLRVYAQYMRQAGINYTQDYIAQSLCLYPQLARSLFALFAASFTPGPGEAERQEWLGRLHKAIDEGLAAVPSLDDDRILRLYVKLIDATLRTNYFQRSATGGAPANLALKFASRSISILPAPRPFREIFVYGAEVEGVHLRFGPVARGGLRWSDRGQDYRTEVLGLVKAQQVKNAVIVPVGAKGGFFPRRLPAGGSREAVFEAGREAYKSYIRTLLSVTDNIDGQAVLPPASTVRRDGDDPYFVVAADKGTATFSDTANGLADEAGFWLGDAFASGGSAGYDHKKMGITARGAWEAVKRHFREMNIDIQKTPFTAIGVGDMSGDVFGNGMLLSEQTRLVAAFDHRDIFIDPAPDPAIGFAERKRLFELPRSSWQDYNVACLSQGGTIISRQLKSATLSPEAATAIGLAPGQYTPFEIMTAILKAPVDLLWFGGIGTYVKAAEESNAAAGDRANDAIRINADEVGAKVIGEGANLGVTQKGRIAYGLKGGRSNSDAIDNSAGVNCSDVEVNIKIALASAMRADRLGRADRDELLVAMTDDVAAICLENNYRQTLSISLTLDEGDNGVLSLSRMMDVLEKAGQLDRKVETLPDRAGLKARRQAGQRLTRPEIAVLLSYAKIVLFDQILASDLPDEPYFAETLSAYFPARMRETFAEDIVSHRLRREIISTRLANDVINRGGASFIIEACDATAMTPEQVVRAAIIVRDGFGLEALWQSVDSLDGQVDGAVQNALYARLRYLYSVLTHLLLKNGLADGDIPAAIAQLSQALLIFRDHADTLLPDARAQWLHDQRASWAKAGVPDEIADNIARHVAMLFVPEALQIARRADVSLEKAADTYFTVTRAFGVSALLTSASRISLSDFYESMALLRSMDQISAARRDLAAIALLRYGEESEPVTTLKSAYAVRIDQITEQLAQLVESGDISLARITVAAGLLSDMARELSV